MTTIAIVVAAGRGTRAASERGFKQYVPIGGRSVLGWALVPFLQHAGVDRVQVVIHEDDAALYGDAVVHVASDKLLPAVTGGATRQQSVLAGLRSVADWGASRVLIHDAARPFVSASDIDRVLAALVTHAGAIVAVPVADTLKREATLDGTIADTVKRDRLWRAQTPQAFRFGDILSAHELAASSGRDSFTDDASIAEAAGLDVALVEGSERNFKITTLDDLVRAERDINNMASQYRAGEFRVGEYRADEFRTGTGFDVHAFDAGDHVWLCGVKVPHGQSLKGHSDADVAMHALTDAIYGALAEGDIGAHFPPSDPQWKGAASHIFLEHARDRVAQRGGSIVNADVTIMCEAPKIGPHRDAMRSRLAEILTIDVDRVAVKATTTEQLGFTGRREGIAAMASVMVRLG